MLEAGEELQTLLRLKTSRQMSRGTADAAEDEFQVAQDDLDIAVGKGGGDQSGYLPVFRVLEAMAEGEGVVGKVRC